MNLHAVARRYAGALADVARRTGDLDAAGVDLQAFARLVSEHADLKRVLESPGVPPDRKKALVDTLFTRAGGATQEVRRLLMMLAERDRLALLQEITALYSTRLMAERHIVEARVVTAVRLPDGQRAALAAALGRAAGAQVTITEQVDPSILGGVVAHIGSIVFDGSVTTQIERMKRKLLESA